MTSDRGILAAFFLFACAVFLGVANWVPEEVDTEVGFQATRALALRGDLHLEPDTPSAKMILEYAKTPAAQGDAYNCRMGRGGLQYPYWGIAYIAAGVPAYWIGAAVDRAAPAAATAFAARTFTSEHLPGSEFWARVAVLSMQPIFAAAALAMVFAASRRAGASRGAALFAAASLGFATHFLAQARSGLSDMQAVFFVAWGVERALAAAKSPSVRRSALLGLACGLALLTKVHCAAAFPALLLLAVSFGGSAPLLARARAALRIAPAFLAGVAAPAAVFFIANAVRWGSPLITGYEKSTSHDWFYIPIVRGLAAELFAPSKGVAWFALPIVACGAAGLVVLARRGRFVLAAALALLAAGTIASIARTIEWHGSWAFGPRYALLAYPALAVAAAAAVDAAAPRLRRAAAVSFAAGVAIVLPAAFTSPFAAMAHSVRAAQVLWPDDTFPPEYDAAARESERFQRLCLEAGPAGFLRGQHAFARSVLLRDGRLRWREDFAIDRDGTVDVPALAGAAEFSGAGSVGWLGFHAWFGGSAVFAWPVLLAAVAAAAALRLVRLLRAAADEPFLAPKP